MSRYAHTPAHIYTMYAVSYTYIDRPKVLTCDGIPDRDHIHFWEGIREVEIFFEEWQHPRAEGQSKLGLF